MPIVASVATDCTHRDDIRSTWGPWVRRLEAAVGTGRSFSQCTVTLFSGTSIFISSESVYLCIAVRGENRQVLVVCVVKNSYFIFLGSIDTFIFHVVCVHRDFMITVIGDILYNNWRRHISVTICLSIGVFKRVSQFARHSDGAHFCSWLILLLIGCRTGLKRVVQISQTNDHTYLYLQTVPRWWSRRPKFGTKMIGTPPCDYRRHGEVSLDTRNQGVFQTTSSPRFDVIFLPLMWFFLDFRTFTECTSRTQLLGKGGLRFFLSRQRSNMEGQRNFK